MVPTQSTPPSCAWTNVGTHDINIAIPTIGTQFPNSVFHLRIGMLNNNRNKLWSVLPFLSESNSWTSQTKFSTMFFRWTSHYHLDCVFPLQHFKNQKNSWKMQREKFSSHAIVALVGINRTPDPLWKLLAWRILTLTRQFTQNCVTSWFVQIGVDPCVHFF